MPSASGVNAFGLSPTQREGDPDLLPEGEGVQLLNSTALSLQLHLQFTQGSNYKYPSSQNSASLTEAKWVFGRLIINFHFTIILNKLVLVLFGSVGLLFHLIILG